MGIQLKGQAFKFENPAIPKSTSFTNFLQWCASQNGRKEVFPFLTERLDEGQMKDLGFHRYIFVQERTVERVPLFLGAVVSMRNSDARKFERLPDGNFRIHLESDTDSCEANLFVIRGDTWRGLYSTYHTSLQLGVWLNGMRKTYSTFVDKMRSNAREKELPAELKNYKVPTKKDDHGPLRMEKLLSRKEWEAFLANLESVDQIEMTVFEPLSDDSPRQAFKQERVKQIFDGAPCNKKMLSWLRKLSESARSGFRKPSGNVQGKSKTGRDIEFNLADTPEDYLGLEYEALADFQTDKIHEIKIIKTMIDELFDKALFYIPAE